MDNAVYIPVCRGWSINGTAQWDVVAVPTKKAYKMGDDTVYYNGTMYSGRFQLPCLNLEKVRTVKISSGVLLDFFNQPVIGLVFLDKSNLDLFPKVTQRLFFSHYFTSGY